MQQSKYEIMVSVICTAYNHEAYIGKALDGFIMQKTSFRFQVFVHDDASTDGTRAIIQRYAEQHPDLIVPIYQEENQYSKGIRITKTFIEPLIHSKYIAICEGDDYWCDPEKLQIQFDYMDTHPECSMCTHNSGEINENGEPLDTCFSLLKSEMDVPLERIIMWGKIFQTASYFYRTDLKKAMPEWFSIPEVGDYPLSMYMAMYGKVHYMPRIMSQYRVLSQGSWTQRMDSNTDAKLRNQFEWLEAIERIDNNTNKLYTELFHKAKAKYSYGLIATTVEAKGHLLSKKLWLKLIAFTILRALNLLDFARKIKHKLTRKAT